MEVPAIKGIDPKTKEEVERESSDDEPLSLLGLQDHERPVCRFADLLPHLFRCAGKGGSTLLNTVKGKRERIGRMLQMHSNSPRRHQEAYAGDIVAIAGLKDTTTGDTLCDAAEAGDP